MIKHIFPAKVKGIIQAPASKSYLQRVLAIALCAKGESVIKGYSESNDVNAAIQIAQKLGAKITISKHQVNILGLNHSYKSEIEINCQEAGLSARMFSPIIGLYYKKIKLNGSGSLLNRPFNMVEDALIALGKNVKSNNGFLPLEISGVFKKKEITIDGSETSQLLTGLLIALPQLKHNTILHVTNLKSIPYVKMTISILKKFGIIITHNRFNQFNIKGNQIPIPKKINIEGDWSGASFMLVAAAINGNVLVKGLNKKSLQADIKIIDVLKLCGAQIHFIKDGIYVSKNKLTAFNFDCTHCPDLFPVLAALAVNCKGTSTLTGTNRLINKESNRALTIKKELTKLGVEISLHDNEMKIKGRKISGANLNSHNDHRIAMMLAILGLTSENGVTIKGAECVAKSYPTFFEDLLALTSN